jgi:hypothetical protein
MTTAMTKNETIMGAPPESRTTIQKRKAYI